MAVSTETAMGVAFLASSVIYLSWRLHNRDGPKGLPLPPGPKRWMPWIGNAFSIPVDHPWLVYEKWHKTYGDMIYVKAFGAGILILGSLEDCSELLEKRSSNYSDRPRFPMVTDLMGWDWLIAFLPYGERWKAQRRAISTFMNRNLAKQYRPVQLDEARNLLGRLLVSPELFYDHARHIVGATIMRITYGIKVAHENDKYIKQAELAVSQLSYAGHPTRFYANVFHSLTHVPAWFPGAQFKRDAAIWKIDTTKFCNMPIDAVKANMVSGNAHLSIASALLESPNGHGSRADTQAFAGEVAGAVYAAGAHTTVSTVQSFFLAMAMYPEAQHRAQKELDAVVGKSRLPEFDDLDKLPYIAAVCKELLRWIPVAPLGVYHASVNDDVYKGYYIPKGTLVVGNTWSILHDPTVYPDPDAFNPDRFLVDGRLNPSIRDPGCAAFGFGRRICPGRDFLADSLAIIVASVLAMYNIDPPQDE